MIAAMNRAAYGKFLKARDDFKAAVAVWNARLPGLAKLEDELRVELGYDDYAIETPIVFNEALDDVGAGSNPAWILVADNPGKNEQKAANRRYLVGQAGKLAAGFFDKRLHMDFRADVLIINKTPIHTPKTAELPKLLKKDPRGELRAVFEESQRFMARLAFRLNDALGLPVWICGKSGLAPGGLFAAWFDEFRAAFADRFDAVTVQSHFSMNRFSVELAEKADPRKPLLDEILRIGAENRKAVFGR